MAISGFWILLIIIFLVIFIILFIVFLVLYVQHVNNSSNSINTNVDTFSLYSLGRSYGGNEITGINGTNTAYSTIDNNLNSVSTVTFNNNLNVFSGRGGIWNDLYQNIPLSSILSYSKNFYYKNFIDAVITGNGHYTVQDFFSNGNNISTNNIDYVTITSSSDSDYNYSETISNNFNPYVYSISNYNINNNLKALVLAEDFMSLTEVEDYVIDINCANSDIQTSFNNDILTTVLNIKFDLLIDLTYAYEDIRLFFDMNAVNTYINNISSNLPQINFSSSSVPLSTTGNWYCFNDNSNINGTITLESLNNGVATFILNGTFSHNIPILPVKTYDNSLTFIFNTKLASSPNISSYSVSNLGSKGLFHQLIPISNNISTQIMPFNDGMSPYTLIQNQPYSTFTPGIVSNGTTTQYTNCLQIGGCISFLGNFYTCDTTPSFYIETSSFVNNQFFLPNYSTVINYEGLGIWQSYSPGSTSPVCNGTFEISYDNNIQRIIVSLILSSTSNLTNFNKCSHVFIGPVINISLISSFPVIPSTTITYSPMNLTPSFTNNNLPSYVTTNVQGYSNILKFSQPNYGPVINTQNNLFTNIENNILYSSILDVTSLSSNVMISINLDEANESSIENFYIPIVSNSSNYNLTYNAGQWKTIDNSYFGNISVSFSFVNNVNTLQIILIDSRNVSSNTILINPFTINYNSNYLSCPHLNDGVNIIFNNLNVYLNNYSKNLTYMYPIISLNSQINCSTNIPDDVRSNTLTKIQVNTLQIASGSIRGGLSFINSPSNNLSLYRNDVLHDPDLLNVYIYITNSCQLFSSGPVHFIFSNILNALNISYLNSSTEFHIIFSENYNAYFFDDLGNIFNADIVNITTTGFDVVPIGTTPSNNLRLEGCLPLIRIICSSDYFLYN